MHTFVHMKLADAGLELPTSSGPGNKQQHSTEKAVRMQICMAVMPLWSNALDWLDLGSNKVIISYGVLRSRWAAIIHVAYGNNVLLLGQPHCGWP